MTKMIKGLDSCCTIAERKARLRRSGPGECDTNRRCGRLERHTKLVPRKVGKFMGRQRAKKKAPCAGPFFSLAGVNGQILAFSIPFIGATPGNSHSSHIVSTIFWMWVKCSSLR
jgi:hypothetical protein